MEKPNILLSNTTKIQTIELIDGEIELIDIQVEDQHTFWISDENKKNWTLTHNCGAPDIDCVNFDHLVVMADDSYKKAGRITKGDLVKGVDGNPHVVLDTYHRVELRENEKSVSIIVEAEDGTLGCFDVVEKHKFVLNDETIKYAIDLCEGDRLMATCPVTVKKIKTFDGMFVGGYVDLTVEGDHRFYIVPFDVIVSDEGELIETWTYN